MIETVLNEPFYLSHHMATPLIRGGHVNAGLSSTRPDPLHHPPHLPPLRIRCIRTQRWMNFNRHNLNKCHPDVHIQGDSNTIM